MIGQELCPAAPYPIYPRSVPWRKNAHLRRCAVFRGRFRSGLVPAAVRASSTQPIALSLVPQARKYHRVCGNQWQTRATNSSIRLITADCGNLPELACYHTSIAFMNIPHLTQAARKYAIGVTLILLALVVAGFAAHLSLGSDKTYRSDAYHFSVRIPKTYTVSDIAPQSGVYRIIDFSQGSDTVQLTLSTWPDNGSVLTTESVIDQYPYAASAEPFAVAPGVIGLAMHNDPVDPAAISGIWFAYKGNLYQFSSFENGIEELLPIVHTLELH
jgi:hypothetical protein